MNFITSDYLKLSRQYDSSVTAFGGGENEHLYELSWWW
jgi:hypothetical protein